MANSPERLRKTVELVLSGRRAPYPRLQQPTFFLYPDVLSIPWHNSAYEIFGVNVRFADLLL